MLTRLEIDGFKSFEKLDVSLPPFAVIIGPNAVGKSNLFDALRFVSQLAAKDVRSAASELRGEPHELFRHIPGQDPGRRIRFALELLLNPTVTDAYNQVHRLKCTRVRYELTVERRDVSGIERLYVIDERVNAIRRSSDTWRPIGKNVSQSFDKHFLHYTNRSTPYLDTIHKDTGQSTFEIHQDAKQGRVRQLPAQAAETTVLSTITTAGEFLHLYALREELRALQFLQLDPAAERAPSDLNSPEMLMPNGANLAAVLFRIRAETSTDQHPNGALSDLVADLADLVPGVQDLKVERDEERREYRFSLFLRDGQSFTSRVASDGTLRVLALLAVLHDPRRRGIICFEEPENGVNKARLRRLVRLLREACALPFEQEVTEEDSLMQIIINSHSPVVADELRDEIIVASISEVIENGQSWRRASLRPYRMSSQSHLPLNEEQKTISTFELERLLDLAEADEFAA